MKYISVILFMLTLLCQVAYSQEASYKSIIMSFDSRTEKKVSLNSKEAVEVLKSQLRAPKDYEFRIQLVKGTKDKIVEKDDLGYAHERYAQYYKGIKVEHSDIRTHYLNDKLTSINGEYIDVQNIDINVILSKEVAIQKAKEYVGAKKYMWEDETENNWLKSIANDKTASFYPNPEIVICKNSIDPQDSTFHIAYKVDIYAKEPVSRDYIFVDAKNGKVLAVNPILVNYGSAATRYNGACFISTQQIGNAYRLRGYENNRSVETYNMKKGIDYSKATDFIDNDNNWTSAEFHNANKDDGALDAHWGATMTYDYFRKYHGRNSYDNNGSVLRNYVHTNLVAMGYSNNDNAFWDGLRMTYGDGTSCDILTSVDVVAHEIGHGVCQFSAGLVYQGESGAINESLSDIWGACVELHYAATNKQTWLMGEDMGCTLRSMSNPKAYNNPNTYQGVYWINPSSSYDRGGVHINSGVMNYWFYLLSVGGSGVNDKGNSYSVNAVYLLKSAKIAYRAETVYMTANTNFANARAYTIQAAIDLYGAYSNEEEQTTNAWYAVGVGSQFVCPPSNLTNQTVTTNRTVTSPCGDISVQNVTVTNGAKLTLDAAKEVTITSDFEVAYGAELEIK